MITAILPFLLICTPSGDENFAAKVHSPKAAPAAKARPVGSYRSPGKNPGFDKPHAAAAFWTMQRLNTDGTMPDNGFVIAKAQRDAMVQPFAAGISAASWTWLGPTNIGGRLRGVAIHPTNVSTMWVGSVGGGVWKTINGGASWTPCDDFLAVLGVDCLTIDNVDPNILYAGTGEGFFHTGLPGTNNNAFKKGAGIFKTLDGGTSWNQLASTANSNFDYVSRVAISPADHNILLAATNTGVFRSTNGGTSWTQVVTGLAYQTVFHPTDGTKCLAGMSNGIAKYSLDGGVTWANATGTTGDRVELAYAKSSPTTVYAAIAASAADTIKVYQSTNGGQTFVLKTSGSGVGCYENYNVTLWVDPTTPTRLIVGGVYLWRSLDSGTTFSQVFTNVHADMHVIVEQPGYNGSTNKIAFFGTDGGIYKTTDATANSTTNINNNLGVTQFYGAAMSDASGKMLAGAQDNGTDLFQGAANTWIANVIGGDGGFCAWDQTDPNYCYGMYYYASIYRTSDAGLFNSPSYLFVGSPSNGSSAEYNFINYFTLDPNNMNRMWSCGRRIYRCDNVKTGNPVTWVTAKDVVPPMSPIPPKDHPKDPPQAHFEAGPADASSTLTVAPGNSNLVYVGYNNGQVWKSTNATAVTPTWTRLDNNPGPLPDRYVSKIVIDPSNTNRVYVAFMGFQPNNLWRTTDGGTSWLQITGSGASALPSISIDGFAQNRLNPNWLYAGTDIGIFTSSDDGVNWTTMTDGPGTVPIAELFWRNNNTLIAATHGRGVYSAAINLAAEPVLPSGYSVVRGRNMLGGLHEMLLSDDRYLSGNPGVVFANSQPPVEIELTAVSPITACASLKFSVESAASTTSIAQTVSLYNYTTLAWENLDVRNLTVTDAVVDVIQGTDPTRFIEAGTRNMKARLGYKATAAVFVYPWSMRIDQAKWTLTP